MTIVKEPERKLKHVDEPIKADKWRGWGFLRDGSIHRGLVSFPTESECIAIIADTEDRIKNLINRGDGWVNSLDGRFKASEYSHGIPMPEKE